MIVKYFPCHARIQTFRLIYPYTVNDRISPLFRIAPPPPPPLSIKLPGVKAILRNKSPFRIIPQGLTDRFQRVVLNGQCSTWKELLAGVPQGSLLGPLFFLVYINDLPVGLQSNVKIFADG